MEKKSKIEEMLNLEENPANKNIEYDTPEKVVDFNVDDYFSDEETKPAEKIEEEVPKKKAKKIDMTKLNMLDSTPMDKEKFLRNALYGNSTALQVVAAQSGYMAKMMPLVNKDIIGIMYSNLSRYEYRKTIFKIIYDKIVAFSFGKMSFEEWLKNTSVEDIETFYYGVYCATFDNQGKFTFKCPKCGNEETLKVNHAGLFKTANNEKMKQHIREVSKNATTREAMQQYSMIGKTEAFQLPDSGIIAEVRTPSLWDSLEILRVVPDSVIDRDSTSVTNMLYIKRFLIPVKTEEISGYTEQLDAQEILRIIDNLSPDDASILQETISDRVDDNRISYSIKNVKCQKCNNEISEIPISIEDILFSLIFEKMNL